LGTEIGKGKDGVVVGVVVLVLMVVLMMQGVVLLDVAVVEMGMVFVLVLALVLDENDGVDSDGRGEDGDFISDGDTRDLNSLKNDPFFRPSLVMPLLLAPVDNELEVVVKF